MLCLLYQYQLILLGFVVILYDLFVLQLLCFTFIVRLVSANYGSLLYKEVDLAWDMIIVRGFTT